MLREVFPGMRVVIVFHTIQPHAGFQGLALHRMLMGTGIELVIRAVAATKSRHDNGYLNDGAARAIREAWKCDRDGILIPSTWRE